MATSPTRQRARDEREAAAQVAALQAELAEANVRVIERPGYDERRGTKALEELVTDKGKQIAPASHASCPGHAAYIANEARRPGSSTSARSGARPGTASGTTAAAGPRPRR